MGYEQGALFQLKATWLRTNGVYTNGAAANVINYDRLGKKVRPGTFEKIQVGLREYPEKSLCQQKHDICSDPISADSICTFPSHSEVPSRALKSSFLDPPPFQDPQLGCPLAGPD